MQTRSHHTVISDAVTMSCVEKETEDCAIVYYKDPQGTVNHVRTCWVVGTDGKFRYCSKTIPEAYSGR